MSGSSGGARGESICKPQHNTTALLVERSIFPPLGGGEDRGREARRGRGGGGGGGGEGGGEGGVGSPFLHS